MQHYRVYCGGMDLVPAERVTMAMRNAAETAPLKNGGRYYTLNRKRYFAR